MNASILECQSKYTVATSMHPNMCDTIIQYPDLVTLFSKNPVGLGINIHLKVQLNVKCSG